MVLVLFFVITTLVMIIIYGSIQPRGLVLSVRKKTVNTVQLGIETNATLPPTTVIPTPPLIRGKGAKIGSKFDRAELPLPTADGDQEETREDGSGGGETKAYGNKKSIGFEAKSFSIFPFWRTTPRMNSKSSSKSAEMYIKNASSDSSSSVPATTGKYPTRSTRLVSSVSKVATTTKVVTEATNGVTSSTKEKKIFPKSTSYVTPSRIENEPKSTSKIINEIVTPTPNESFIDIKQKEDISQFQEDEERSDVSLEEQLFTLLDTLAKAYGNESEPVEI